MTVDSPKRRSSRSPELKPIERVPTSHRIADQLRKAIVEGTFQPGAQLGEAELAARFDVSRGPLREAMQHLVAEGLLTNIRHRGLFVATLTPEDIRDIYVVRGAIESAAIKLILAGDPDRAAARLGRAHARMAAAAERKDRRALSKADLAFHKVLVAESGSPRLKRLANTLLTETRMCINALQDTYHTPLDLADEHAVIVDAIANHDLERALQTLDNHMQDAVQRIAPPTAERSPST